MSSIFLSHNFHDKEFVRRLGKDLRSRGIRVWIDEAEILVGDSLITKIENAIDEMEYLGVILSPNSIKSQWVTNEVNAALTTELRSKRVKVFPILLKNCELPAFLRGKLYADFRKEENYEKALDLLVRSLKRRRSSKTNRRKKPKITSIFKSMMEEEKLSAILAIAFGSLFWQINHILHWMFGLSYSQIDISLGSMRDIGETRFDSYMGIAQLILLSLLILPTFSIFKNKVNILASAIMIIPIIINFLLWKVRGRASASSLGLILIQSGICIFIMKVGEIRKELISLFENSSNIDDFYTNPRILEIKSLVFDYWIASIVSVVLICIAGGGLIVALIVAQDSTFSWKIRPEERQSLEVLFAISTIALFSEAVFLLWYRLQAIKAWLNSG